MISNFLPVVLTVTPAIICYVFILGRFSIILYLETRKRISWNEESEQVRENQVKKKLINCLFLCIIILFLFVGSVQYRGYKRFNKTLANSTRKRVTETKVHITHTIR